MQDALVHYNGKQHSAPFLMADICCAVLDESIWVILKKKCELKVVMFFAYPPPSRP